MQVSLSLENDESRIYQSTVTALARLRGVSGLMPLKITF